MINALTSLRFIFALMVFGAHCYIIEDLFDIHFFKEGFVGVSFFFVALLFLITTKIVWQNISRQNVLFG